MDKQQNLRVAVEAQLGQVAFDYDARRLQAAMAIRFGVLQQYREAFTLLQAKPGWQEIAGWGGLKTEKPQLVFTFTCESQTVKVRSLYRTIAAIARESEVDRVILTWRGAKAADSYQIVSSMGEGDDIFDLPPPLTLNSSLTDTMLIGEEIRKSEFPMGLVINGSDWQVWGNQPLSVMTGKPMEELTRLNVRSNWVDRRAKSDDGLALIKSQLRTKNAFNMKYETKVSADAVGKHHFYSNFRLVLGSECRLTTVYEYVPVA